MVTGAGYGLLATAWLALAATEVPPPGTSVSVGGTTDSLTVIAEDAALRDLLEYLAHHQRLAVEAHAGLAGRVSIEIVDEPLAAVVRQLLRDYNFTLEIAPAGAMRPAGRLWIHPRLGAAAASDVDHFGVTGRDDTLAAGQSLRRGDDAGRLDGTAVLAAFGGDDSFVLLVSALYDPDPAVREEAVAGLGDRHPAAGVHLVAAALADPAAAVRDAAFDALADIGSPAAVAALAGLLADARVEHRRQAVDALGEIDGDAATRALRRALADADASVRDLARDYLAER